MDTLSLSLVTPEATFFSGDTTLVEAPGTLGDFGVLPGHMDFISTLKPGVVTVHNHNEQISRIFVAGGIAEVSRGTSVTILAERVIDLSKITLPEAEARLAKARADLDNTFDDPFLTELQREAEIAEAIIQALAA